jgi:hypothetical protein
MENLPCWHRPFQQAGFERKIARAPAKKKGAQSPFVVGLFLSHHWFGGLRKLNSLPICNAFRSIGASTPLPNSLKGDGGSGPANDDY